MRDWQEISLWRDVSPERWNDWRWQVSHRLTDVEGLRAIVSLSDGETAALEESLHLLRMAITPYYACLIDGEDPFCPARMQAIPTLAETRTSPADFVDPLQEDHYSPVPGLTHRYPDRAILLVTDQCALYCRHCTRRRFAGETDRSLPRETVRAALDYLRATSAIRDLLITGGDPLLLDDESLSWLLGELRSIAHLEIIRFGTRAPAVLPMRITDDLCRMLKRHHPLWINVHFNHPKELTDEATQALERLADAGIPLGNQSVLLKGVNDCPYIFRELNQQLLHRRVRPYYIYQCDLSQGIEHFRTSVGKGIEIIEYLRGHTSGLAVPTFVVDAPGGGGKIPVMPDYVVSRSDRKVLLRNFEGVITTYTEPDDNRSLCHGHCHDICERQKDLSQEGLIPLMEGKKLSIEPTELGRREKRRLWS